MSILKRTAGSLAGAAMAAGALMMTASPASAEHDPGVGGAAGGAAGAAAGSAICQGENERQQAVYNEALVKMDSCNAEELVELYDATGSVWSAADNVANKNLVARLATTSFKMWATFNQEQLEQCAAAGTGIQWQEINGLVFGCEAQ